VKGEVMAFTALMQALTEKEQCTARKNKAQSLMNSEQQMVNKISSNKFSFKLMFKS